MVMHRLLRLAVGHFHASGALASEAVRKNTSGLFHDPLVSGTLVFSLVSCKFFTTLFGAGIGQCAGDDSRPLQFIPLSGTHIQILKGLAVRVIQQDRIGFPLLKHITLSPLPQRHNNGKHGAPFSVRTYSLYALPSDAGKISKIPISTRCFSREARIFWPAPNF